MARLNGLCLLVMLTKLRDANRPRTTVGSHGQMAMLCDKMDSGSFLYATASEAVQLVSAIDFNFLRRFLANNATWLCRGEQERGSHGDDPDERART